MVDMHSIYMHGKKEEEEEESFVFCGLLGGDDLSCRLEAGRGCVCV